MPDGPDSEAELAELRRLAERVRPAEVTWEEPPADLWGRISAAVSEEATGFAATPPEQPEPGADSSVVSIAMASRRRRAWLAAALAAAAALVVVVAVAVLRNGDPSVLAATELDLLGKSGSGRAELIEHDGQVQLRVETADLDAGDGYLELWLIDPTVSRLISLGPLRADGTYDVPAGVTPAEFPIVDISAEALDGDPTHSGQSLLRGELPL
jgi:anti-sigma-K factor RskA